VIHVQPEDGHYQAPKHVVVLYVIIEKIYTSLHHIVVSDSKFTYSIIVYYKHNGGDETYDSAFLVLTFDCSKRRTR